MVIRLPYAAINHPEVVIIAKPTSKKAWTTFLDHGSQLVVAIHLGLVLFGDHLATPERLRRVATAATMLFQLSWWLPTNVWLLAEIIIGWFARTAPLSEMSTNFHPQKSC